MHWKQRIAAVLALVCMTCAVAASSRLEMTGADEGQTGLSVFRKKETIYFWYADETMSDYFNSAAVAFGQKRNVRVIPVLVRESEYLEAVNHATLHENHIPDVYIVSNDSLEKAYLAGIASEITDAGGSCTTDNFPQTALSAVTYHDKLVAYPLSFETSALVYNASYQQEWARQQAQKELNGTDEEGADEETEGASGLSDAEAAARKNMTLEELTEDYIAHSMPVTVDDILEIGDTFDVPDGVEGILKWDVSDIFYNYWFVGNYMVVGSDAGDDEHNINVNNSEVIQCLEVYKTLHQFFSIESDTVTFDSVVQDFIDGKIVFTIATTDVLKKLEAAKKDGTLTHEYGVAMMPAVSNELKSRSLSVTSAVAVNGYSEHKELANEFASYLVMDCSEDLYERTGKMAANLHADSDNDSVQIFKDEYAKSVSLPKMIVTSNYWIQLEVLFARVWNGQDSTLAVADLEQQLLSQVSVP